VVSWLAAQFPDLAMSIQAIVAERDLVAVRVRASGTAAPTGKTVVSEQSHWYRVTDSRLCEYWATRDDLSTRPVTATLQVVPPGPRVPPAVQTLRYGLDPYGFFESAHRAFGDVFTVGPMGERWVVLAHPDAVRGLYTYALDEVASGVANMARGGHPRGAPA